MEKFIVEYLGYLTAMMQTDIQQFNNWWMFLPFLIPAALFLVWLLIKYMLLTVMFWLPVRMAFGSLRGMLWYNEKKKKNKDAEKGSN
jgi:hypothetical protein